MVAEELPEVIAARVVERVQTGESAVEVAAWLVDLGHWVTPEDVAVIAAWHSNRTTRTATRARRARTGGNSHDAAGHVPVRL